MQEMLCILYLSISWTKADRNLQGSLIRKQYIKPYPVDTYSVPFNDGLVFRTDLHYVQNGDKMNLEKSNVVLDLQKIDIRNIGIEKEEDSYRIKWHEETVGDVNRRGGNEDYGRKGASLRSYPNRLNETAFVLSPGQSGVISWNNRFTSYYGQKYEQYQAYFINTNSIDVNMFVREYDFEYKQLADLF